MRSPIKQRALSEDDSPVKQEKIIEEVVESEIDVMKRIFNEHKSTQIKLKNQTAGLRQIRMEIKEQIKEGEAKLENYK